MTRKPSQRLDDISESIQSIRNAQKLMNTADVGHDEDAHDVAYDAILYRLLVIGEAVKTLPSDLKDTEPDIDWNNIARMRDILAHQYHRVDANTVHLTCDQPLDQLFQALPRLKDTEQANPDEPPASGDRYTHLKQRAENLKHHTQTIQEPTTTTSPQPQPPPLNPEPPGHDI